MLINETAGIIDFVVNDQVQVLPTGLHGVTFGKRSRDRVGRIKAEGGRRKAEGLKDGGETNLLGAV